MATIDTDICVIGAGSGGLSVAAGAAQMGASTVLIERGAMGGDCLNYGCVPSKSMIAAGRAADTIRHAGRFGVNGHEPQIDFGRVHDHIHGVIAAIAPNDSVERFEGLGVRVIQADGRFTGPDTVEAGGTTIKARRFVLATGSRASHPPIPGLDAVPFLTNETVFERKAAPEHLIVIGGGPIGVEMAQAHRRLGADVTVLQKGSILPKDDPDLVAVVRGRLVADGVVLREEVDIAQVERHGNGIAAVLADGTRIEGSDLLVAAGRQANVDGLGLEAAGIEFSSKGVTTDARLRTTNRRVFAVGDVAGGPQFTHIAGYHAGIVIRNVLFRLPAKVDYSALPWVTYTDPELAHVGLTEAQARESHKDIRVLTWDFEENDRAQAERETEGRVKVLTLPNGRILGASIVGPHAGELIQVWCLAISQKLKIGAIASMIAPYPTLGEAGKRAAGSFYTPKLFSGRTRGLVRFLSWFG
ncbi:dihydrolipoamide dehydrogenase [Skermanella aerolata]|uniref:Dihydrolipoamide dehydrogenase n=1 Tax=Skermanella aerolata TaxID=393310 RepID=A0A512DWL6_9PROT|nr:FAD-dependent oxidoreductase [Skermanella aerolata]KJB93675.1 dihydrolipoamide dehydrogenase [Skermanella aerolata KACC 11604]GEO40867.1 dihydrolipoamide dehydrogenase [Skermanella aerolata]